MNVPWQDVFQTRFVQIFLVRLNVVCALKDIMVIKPLGANRIAMTVLPKPPVALINALKRK